MKVVKLSLIFVLSFLVVGVLDITNEGVYRKASYSTEAIYKVPGSSVEIVLERRAIHLFLAEYERTLVLRIDSKERIRKEVAVDTGGYSRMNVYQTSRREYFLSGALNFDKYLLDISKPSFSQEFHYKTPKDAKFVGSFDRDEEGWRFISAHERNEQKSKL